MMDSHIHNIQNLKTFLFFSTKLPATSWVLSGSFKHVKHFDNILSVKYYCSIAELLVGDHQISENPEQRETIVIFTSPGDALYSSLVGTLF